MKSGNEKAGSSRQGNVKAAKPSKTAKSGKFQPKNKNAQSKPAKDMTAVIKKKPVKKIVYFYYFIGNDAGAREIINNVGAEFNDAADIWPQLNLVEVVMKMDSLIFQDAKEVFVDPLDLEYFNEKGITSMFQISFDVNDIEAVRKVMKNIMTGIGGILCSDTDDFEPSYTAENIDSLTVA